MNQPVEEFKFWEYKRESGGLTSAKKPVVLEHQMELIINGQSWLRFICSPTHLEALGVGFLYCENVIRSLKDIKSLVLSEDGEKLEIALEFEAAKPQAFHRTSTSVTIDSKILQHEVDSHCELKADDLFRLYREFNEMQVYHQQAGGFHSASLCDQEKNRIVVEDLGRHNCVDKLAGLYLLDHEDFSIQALLLSGRISSEMIAKSLAMQVPVLVSRTSPTALAIKTAQALNVTLVGYLRGGQFDVYTHPEKLVI
ncbi:MAG: formate dehydrogenase accessory sulfurtransferase FdhD [Anaerolineaceae bacterium]|nr:formate dehydrogenase accessory sulfurtransferase FdhD [Anaerolineaceae bacterium]